VTQFLAPTFPKEAPQGEVNRIVEVSLADLELELNRSFGRNESVRSDAPVAHRQTLRLVNQETANALTGWAMVMESAVAAAGTLRGNHIQVNANHPSGAVVAMDGLYVEAKKTGAGTVTTMTALRLSASGATTNIALDAVGRVVIDFNDDVDLVGVSGSLIIGGDGTGQHLALDGNEIASKASATTAGTLFLNVDGGAVWIGFTTFNGFFAGVSGSVPFEVQAAGDTVMRSPFAVLAVTRFSGDANGTYQTYEFNSVNYARVGFNASTVKFEIFSTNAAGALSSRIAIDAADDNGHIVITPNGTGSVKIGTDLGISSLLQVGGNATILAGGAGDTTEVLRVGHTGSPATGNPICLFKMDGSDRFQLQMWDGSTSSPVIRLDHGNDLIELLDITIIGAANPGGTMQTRITNASGNLIRLDNSAATNLAWDVRLTSGGALQFRSVNDAGTTTLTAIQVAHATANLTLAAATITMNRDVNHLIEMISTTVEAAHTIRGDANRGGASNGLLDLRGLWNGDDVARVVLTSGADTTNKDDGRIVLQTQANNAGGLVSHVQLMEDGDLEVLSTAYLDIKRSQALGGGATATLGTIGGSGPTAAAQNLWVEIKAGNTVTWLAGWR
jgi:hypothetical protein